MIARAQRLRRWFLEQALALLGQFDILLAPATPFPATPIGQATIAMGGEEVSVRANLGLYTQPISFIGLPVLTVPVIEKTGLPTGVQMIGAPWREGACFSPGRRLARSRRRGRGQEAVHPGQRAVRQRGGGPCLSR